MRFRTEYIAKPSQVRIDHSDRILMLGSCFTDNIGARLQQAGFQVLANPFGPLFNPASIAHLLTGAPSLFTDFEGVSHCLDLPSRYQAPATNKVVLKQKIAEEYADFERFKTDATVAIITLGSAFVYTHLKSNRIVANCHKLPASEFKRTMLSLEQCKTYLRHIADSLRGKTIIFTISPVHHLDNGLEGNFLNKATLRLAVEEFLGENVSYFPAFEIMNDDLRDYRFYAADMKHPSEVAVEYIYSKFEETFFSRTTREQAMENVKAYRRNHHIQILPE